MEEINLNDILPSAKITLKDSDPAVVPYRSPKDTAMEESIISDSKETDRESGKQGNYYIIVGSFKNLTQAQQGAKKIINVLNKQIIILPPTTKGYYRISYGNYSTLEEANANLISIRKNINPDAWIFSVKE